AGAFSAASRRRHRMARHVAMKRRRFVQGAVALVALVVRPAHAALPSIPALDTWLAGRTPRFARLKLSIPAIADNGFAVPMRVVVEGPFAPGPYVKSIRLFSETNPVPDMAVFEFPVPVERVEIESRI